MYKKKTSSQLKQAARGIMIGKYRNAISILLVSDLIISTLSVFSSTASNSFLGITLSFIISLIIFLFGTILDVGQRSFYLNIACEGPYNFSDLFTGFKVHPNKIIITQLLIQLFTTLPIIPFAIFMTIAVLLNNMALILVSSLLLIAGCGISWWLSLKYSQVYYLLLDFPNYSSKELLNMSWKLMKGNVGRLFYIQVSFLPLMLAGLLSCGIGFLFVQPYQYMTYTLFYLDMISEN